MGAERPTVTHLEHRMFDSRAARRPRRVVLRTIGFGASALLAAALLTWSPAPTTGWNQGAAEGTLWQLLNGARTNNGLAPLQHHGTLLGIARWRSQDMLNRNYFSHTIPGCGCLVYAYYDSNGLAYDWAGENIAWNSGHDDASSPINAHERFMGSAGHRANVLTPGFTHGAVGAAAADNQMYLGHVQNTRMYTELFLQAPRAAAPPPPPPPAAPAPAPVTGFAPAPVAQAAPAAPVAAAAAAPAKPKPAKMTVDAPARPRSHAGIDGVATLVPRGGGSDVQARLAADDALGVARWGGVGAKLLGTKGSDRGMEVTAADAEPGFFDGLFGALSD
jgi:uncharacterized protein YkwD